MADSSRDPLGEAIRLYFSFRDQAAERMITFQEEQRTFIRNLLSSGVTSAEANVASADFKKVSINYGRVTEALKLAENALKRARELYDIEIRDAAVEAIVNSSL